MNPLEQVAVKLIADVAGFVKDANKAVDDVTKKAGKGADDIKAKWTTNFGQVGKAIAGAVGGAAIGTAIGVLGQRFAKLDQTMAGVQARAGLTAAQTDKLTKSVIGLSKSNLQSQEEIAGTIEALISLQGVSADNQEQIDSLTQSYLDYALVTGQTAPDAVKAFDDILDAWNLTAEQGVGIMDALVVSHQKFGTDVVGAQGALNKYASTFQVLGLDVNDALGYINLFAASGVDAESAATAFAKAVGLLTDGTDASNAKIVTMASNLGLLDGDITGAGFKALSTSDQFDLLTRAIGNTEDPTLRAQAAIDLFGAKAGPKMAEALAGNGIKDFKINMDDAAGASATAADIIENSFTNKLKLLGNEIMGRAQELTQSFAPALMFLGNPQVTGALGTLAGALGGLKLPDGLLDSIKGLPGAIAGAAGSLAGGIGSVAGGAVNVMQTITQVVSRTPAVTKALIDDLVDKIQNITQKITKVDVTPAADKAATKAGESLGSQAGKGFVTGLGKAAKEHFGEFVTLLTAAAVAGTIDALTAAQALAIASAAVSAGWIILAGAVAAAIAAALYVAFRQLDFSKVQSALLAGIAGTVLGIPIIFGALVSKFGPAIGETLLGLVVDGITSFFTPENIGARLADVVMIALTGLFAVPILLVHFRQPIADMFEALGHLIIDGASALPGLIADAIFDIGAFTDAAGHKYNELRDSIFEGILAAFSIEIPGLGVKISELIAGILFSPEAIVIEAKKGLFDPIIELLGQLPGVMLTGLRSAGDTVVNFFSVTLPGLFTVDTFSAVLNAVVDFFGTTLPEAITVEMPKIPGAVIDGLAGLPDQVLTALGLVTDTVTGWVGSLADWLGTGFVPWDWIKAAAGAFVDEIAGWLALIWGSGIITEWVNNLATWLTANFNPWTWVKAAFDTLVTSVTTAIDGLATTLKTSGTAALLALRNGMIDSVPAVLLWLITLPETIAGKAVGWVTDLAGKFYSAGIVVVHRIGDGIVDGGGYVATKIREFIEDHLNPLNWDIPLLSPFLAAFKHAGALATEQLGDGLREGQNKVDRAVGGLVSGISDGLNRGQDIAKKGASAIIASISDSLRAGRDKISGIIGDAFNPPQPTNPVHNPDGSITLPGGAPPSTIGDAFPAPGAPPVGLLHQWMADIENAGGASASLDEFQAALGQVVQGMNDYQGPGKAFVDSLMHIIENAGGASASLDEAQAAIEPVVQTLSDVQDSLGRVANGTATATDALTLMKAGFTDIAQAVIQYNLGLITAEQLQAILNGAIAASAPAIDAAAAATAAALAQYDLLAAALDGAKQKQLGLNDAQTLLAGGFGDLAQAVLQYNAGLITADDLTKQIQATFTEVATSAIVLGAQWTTAFADAMARQDELDKIGSAGTKIMDQLNKVLTEGGAQNVQALADMAVQFQVALESSLPADQAAAMGDSITAALAYAIQQGTPEAIQALFDLFEQAQTAIDNGTTDLVGSFNDLVGGKLADKALAIRVGRHGADLMAALNTEIESGGKQGVAAAATAAFDIIDAMQKGFSVVDSKKWTDKLMGDLDEALKTGGAAAIAQVQKDLETIQGLLNKTPTSATGPGTNPKAAPPTSGSPPAPPAPPINLNELLWQKSVLSIPELNKLGSWAKALSHFIPLLTGMFANMNLTSFHEFLRGKGLAFASGAIVTQPTVGMFGEHGAEGVFPLGSPAFDRVMASLIDRQLVSGTVSAGGGGSRMTNYGRIIQVFGPGRKSTDVIRDLDRLIS